MVNVVAAIIAAIVNFVIGFIWYSPMVFGKRWQKLSGIDAKKMNEMKKDMPMRYIGGIVTSFIMAWVLAIIIQDYAHATMTSTGALIGFWVWLGFFATASLGMFLWEGKSIDLWTLNNVLHLIVLIVMGAIIGMMP